MSEMQIFESNQFGRIRTVQKDSQPWFVAVDVCRALEIANPTDAIKRLDEDERARFNLGRQGETNCVNEPGLYALVLGSRKPEAKAFKRWITHEVLPTIRNHGAYATGETIDKILQDPDFGIRLLGELKAEREQRRALEAQTAANAPKVLFAQSVECADNDILIGDMAKILRQNGVEVGQKRLFDLLRRDGYLMRSQGANMPTQKSMEMGLMRITERCVNCPDGNVRVTQTPKITGKGQVYFVNRYAGKTA